MDKRMQLQQEIEEINKRKIDAVRAHDFNRAETLRNKELELKHTLAMLQKEENNEPGEAGWKVSVSG